MTNRVVVERTYDRSPESVFDAWIDVDLLGRWFGCGPDTLWEIHEWNAVVGAGCGSACTWTRSLSR